MDKELWIYAHYNEYEKEVSYLLSTYERGDSSGDTLVEKRMISFETLDEKEARVKLAESLKKKLSSMRADHHREETEIVGSISELLALEYKPRKDDDIPF